MRTGNSTSIASTPNFDYDRRTLQTNATYGTATCGNNQQPPIYTTDTQAGIQSNTDPSTYDVLGRRYFLNLVTKF